MSTPTIHSPPRFETVVYSTAFEAPEDGCAICGDPAETVTDDRERLYCGRTHKRKAQQIRNGKRPGELPVDPPAGTCRYCGVEVTQPGPRPGRTCTRASCKTAYGQRGFHRFRRLVKWPHALPWLGPKLGLAPDDPRLPELALALAEKGKLGVYIRADGTVGEVGKLKGEGRAKR